MRATLPATSKMPPQAIDLGLERDGAILVVLEHGLS